MRRGLSCNALPAPTDAPAHLLFDSAFLAKLEQLHLLAKKLFRGEHRAERRSRQIGSSLEFADYRNYAWGDEPRTIDWAVYARLDRLFVKLFEQERDLDVHFLIDASTSMHWASAKFDQARRISAALAYVALANLDRVNVCWFTDTLGEDTGLMRGKPQFHSILDYLRTAPAGSEKTSLLASIRAFTQRLKRTGLVFVLSDFLDPSGYEEALNLLRHHHFEVHLIHVLDTAELSPRLLGDLRLTECETGNTCDITATEALLGDYRKAIGAWLDQLEQFCLQRAIGYVRATTEVPFEDLVLRVLRDGMMLR
jgi:uncharacterized protein (DUF58 family)